MHANILYVLEACALTKSYIISLDFLLNSLL